MKIKLLGKLLILLVVAGVGIGAYRYLSEQPKSGNQANSGIQGVPVPAQVGGDQGILGRPLRVGVVTWPGYAGGLVANGGFKPNRECIYWNNHKLLVEFLLMEDVDARAKAFAKGGPDGVDIVWSTVDFWANELPGFKKDGVDAKAIMQVDWSRGGDAIVVDPSIRRIEDLVNKKISLALFTPSHWLLEYSLQNSSLTEAEQSKIAKGLIGKNASPDARMDFVAGKVDAAVVWEPDVAEALSKRPGSKVLLSTKTASNLIADLMVAQKTFIDQHPDIIKAFVKGWFDGTTEANRRPDLAVKVLMENEPLYKELGNQETLNQISTVKWADLSDNTLMFGLNGKEPLYDRIFNQAGKAWLKRGYVSQLTSSESSKDIDALMSIYGESEVKVEPPKPDEGVKTPTEAKRNEPAIMSKPVNIYFPTGSATLDPNAKGVLDQIALTSQTYSNAYIRVEGNTDSKGSPATNTNLSKLRAQAVVNYLVNKYGLNRDRFIAKGNGPSKPVADNATEAGRAKNRRTDIQVIPAD